MLVYVLWGDMDLGKTSLDKHSIRLMDNTLFKEYYWADPTKHV